METRRQAVRSVAVAAAALAVGSSLWRSASAGTAQDGNQDRPYRKIEYMVPMRDGTRLYTSVYVPTKKPGRHPILLERTPYGAGPYGPDAYRSGFHGSKRFVDAGYVFAYQDVRGRGRSEGVFVNVRPQLILKLKPNDIDESTDAWDTVEYLVKTVPANNGRVGLWGISYPGFYAALGAVNSHPALRAASPQAPVSDWFLGDDFHHNGALFLMDAVGFARFGETNDPKRPALPSISTGGNAYDFYLKNGTLAELTETYFKHTDGMWKHIVDHPTYDEYWQSRSVPSLMRNVRCPVMVVGGWFDAEDCWGALHTAHGTRVQNPKTTTTLVMGPWYHGMWASGGGTSLGDMQFGDATATTYQEKIEYPFFDACLRGPGISKAPAARLFETGANRWRDFSVWPPSESKQTSLFLLAGRRLGIGTSDSTGGGEYDEYVSDPESPVPYQRGVITGRTREYMVDDQRFASKRKDVVSYQSEPLAGPVTIAGPLTADLYVSTTGTDADFVAKVIDVFPESASGNMAGYQNLLRGEVFRAKFRDSFQNPSPLVPNKVTRLTFEMPDLLHTFQPGHRIMVQVQSSWFPLVDRNPQRYTDIYRASADDFQEATMRIWHTREYRSCVRVGVLPARGQRATVRRPALASQFGSRMR